MSTVDREKLVAAEAPAPQPPGRVAVRRLVGAARRWWRWLSSMRTALVLLLLLAVAAIPGSLLPQRSVSPENVDAYLRAHPGLGPWLDRLWAFDVFASPWFSAIYLLLLTSLVGCLVPRARGHLAALLRPPPGRPSPA
jgi:cytochrome c biogenesis protein